MSDMEIIERLCDDLLLDRISPRQFKEGLIAELGKQNGSEATLRPIARAITLRRQLLRLLSRELKIPN